MIISLQLEVRCGHADLVAGSQTTSRVLIPQATEWQHIGNQIDAAFIFARADFVNVHIIFCETPPQAS